jgi:transcription elongation factor Elf1
MLCHEISLLSKTKRPKRGILTKMKKKEFLSLSKHNCPHCHHQPFTISILKYFSNGAIRVICESCRKEQFLEKTHADTYPQFFQRHVPYYNYKLNIREIYKKHLYNAIEVFKRYSNRKSHLSYHWINYNDENKLHFKFTHYKHSFKLPIRAIYKEKLQMALKEQNENLGPFTYNYYMHPFNNHPITFRFYPSNPSKKNPSEMKINKFITLKLEDEETNIYVNGQRFNQCKYLFLQFDKKQSDLDTINSIDEAESQFSKKMEHDHDIITPEQEFWGHCSNLQAWVENDYDTRVLHRTIAFPLLKKLAKHDARAKIRLQEEIFHRLDEAMSDDKSNIINYLESGGYFQYLEEDFQEELSELYFKKKDMKKVYALYNISQHNFFTGDALQVFKDTLKGLIKVGNEEQILFIISKENLHLVNDPSYFLMLQDLFSLNQEKFTENKRTYIKNMLKRAYGYGFLDEMRSRMEGIMDEYHDRGILPISIIESLDEIKRKFKRKTKYEI